MRHIEQPEPKRDRWGRPLVDGDPYTRASTLAKALDDTSNLIKWKARTTALGLAKSPDLIALASTATGDERSKLNEIVDKACDRAGGDSGRDMGTAIHSVSEILDYGQPTDGLPADLIADGEAYRRECRRFGLTPVCGEMFVANRRMQVAGSFDRLLMDSSGRTFIGDLKTGKLGESPDYKAKFSAVSWSIQLAIYANSRPYPGRWRSWSQLDLTPPDKTRGIIFHIPRGSGVCNVIEVDLIAGLAAAKVAAQVRDLRKSNPSTIRGAA